ncbi:DNA replication and repair protein RecF [Moraxella osloensis]|uniref:DNA replication and repair protein RecF n=1 Tax=Faucicola osloensis TaxID=34062 RepID=A0AAD0AFU5_FAUOS|nr:DNA replication and repair protein RecF [Moraxella osloensis]ATQ82361.1 DNA replication and repair protein RecF [Moraxella osloensis]ATW84864.1 DNA replication and repair protein RecF [Moraxella osloensis]
MQIIELTIHHFRNLHTIALQPSSCNVVLGQNGSGKTSLLESIYLLSRGKSFRHHQPRHYIEHGFSDTTVFARLNHEQTVAIAKSQDATTQLRLNGQSLVTQSPLAQLLPTLLLEPVSLAQLEDGSQARREMLDWLGFHVEPSFHPNWLSYQRLLKQRNSLLKQNFGNASLTSLQQQELSAWDYQLSQHAEKIHQARADIIEQWHPHFLAQVQKFLPQYAEKLRLRYTPGFDTEVGLATTLANRLASDIELGYTRMGCHRADINVVLDLVHTDAAGHKHKQTLLATDMLSRGEKKLLVMALRLSQLPLLNQVDKVPLVLVDDITAELDNDALMLLLTGLQQVNSQLFITSLTQDIVESIQKIWQDNVKLFHVEQGSIRQLSLEAKAIQNDL